MPKRVSQRMSSGDRLLETGAGSVGLGNNGGLICGVPPALNPVKAMITSQICKALTGSEGRARLLCTSGERPGPAANWRLDASKKPAGTEAAAEPTSGVWPPFRYVFIVKPRFRHST